MSIISIDHVSFGYEKVNMILNDISLKAEKGKISIILGASGSGKSTLLSIIAGYIKPISGSVRFEKNIKPSYVFQNCYLLDEFNVIENVELPLVLKGYKTSEAKKKSEYMLNLVGINKEKQLRHVRELSGGERNRINIARALVQDSTSILLDEPTASLDSKLAIDFMNFLQKIKKDYAILMVTHNQTIAIDYGDIVYRLQERSLVKIKDEK